MAFNCIPPVWSVTVRYKGEVRYLTINAEDIVTAIELARLAMASEMQVKMSSQIYVTFAELY